MNYIPVASLGQDSHRFGRQRKKPLILGGVMIEGSRGLIANSDGDVVLHAITNAVSGLSCVNILGTRADRLCFEQCIKDSAEYLKEALSYLKDITITHLSVSIECSAPMLSSYMTDMRKSIAKLLSLPVEGVGITATTGEKLTASGKGKGISVSCLICGIKRLSEII